MLKYIKEVEELQAYNVSELNNDKIEDVLLDAVDVAFDNLDANIKHLVRISCSADVADIIFK